MTTAQELGTALANAVNTTATLQSNISPDDLTAKLILFPMETVVVSESGSIIGRYYASSSFIIDHPIQGDLNNASYALDGGYNAGAQTLIQSF